MLWTPNKVKLTSSFCSMATRRKKMSWIVFIIAAIAIIWLHHLYQNKIDREERKVNVSSTSKSTFTSTSTSASTGTPWISLRQKFKLYLDFKVIEETSSSLLIANDKGEEFSFQMVATNNVIKYKVNGSLRKEWKFPFWVHENIMYKEIDKFYKEKSLKTTSKSDVSSATWRVVEERAFTQEEINAVNQAVVVSSQYGNSVQFTMVSGGVTYIPLSQDSDSVAGEIVDITKAKLLTLEKTGEPDIYRVQI